MESKPYRPANGTEGMWFEENHCSKCYRETWNPETDKGRKCSILNKVYLRDVYAGDYPKEWIYGEDGPTCTAFKLPEPRKKTEPKIPGQITF